MERATQMSRRRMRVSGSSYTVRMIWEAELRCLSRSRDRASSLANAKNKCGSLVVRWERIENKKGREESSTQQMNCEMLLRGDDEKKKTSLKYKCRWSKRKGHFIYYLLLPLSRYDILAVQLRNTFNTVWCVELRYSFFFFYLWCLFAPFSDDPFSFIQIVSFTLALLVCISYLLYPQVLHFSLATASPLFFSAFAVYFMEYQRWESGREEIEVLWVGCQ